MKYKIKSRLGGAIFRLFKVFAPSLSERYQHYDTRMFLKEECGYGFNWKEFVNKENQYFKKWGFSVSQMDAEYYGYISGIKADHYLTRSMAKHYIDPYLDRYDFVPSYMDKNQQKCLLGLPDATLDIKATEDVIYNSNGVFFDGVNREEISEQKALEILHLFENDLILKPTVETYGGRGVVKLPSNSEISFLKNLFETYRSDFTFQKAVSQHETMALFNPTSVNTIRIVTYRKPDKSRKILYSVVRYGGAGAVMDNSCSGGGFTGINIETGILRNRICYQLGGEELHEIPASFPNQIPSWDKIIKAALLLHGRLPQMDMIGWDFAVDTEGFPVLIEFNPRPDVCHQMAIGPVFEKEDLDELMAHVSKVKAEYVPLGLIQFADRPDRKTVHLKFGGR